MVDETALPQQLWDFVYAYDAAYDRAARSAGLSAAQACLLKEVVDAPRSMSELAASLLCDASNVTQLVTRLEARGLVRREPGQDRRSKRVAITAGGIEMVDRVRGAFTFPQDRLARLPLESRRELSALLDAMRD